VSAPTQRGDRIRPGVVVVVDEQRVRAAEIEAVVVDGADGLGQLQFDDGAERPGRRVRVHLPGRLDSSPQPQQPVAVAGVGGTGPHRALVGCDSLTDRAPAHRHRAPGRRDPLVHQRGHRDPPALPGRSDHAGRRHADVGEEDFVELRFAGDLAQPAHLDPGGVHVQDEVGKALVFR
jgi:hypothetical protein